MGAKRVALGKGLGALLPEVEQEEGRTIVSCGIEEVFPNRGQPRRYFDEEKLQELADSIKKKGILEPLIVRRREEGYEIIVGERRWRAAQKAGLKEVPVIVKEVEGVEALEMSLIENLQRENLNPLEEAEGYQRLVEEFGLSQEEVAARVGKDRTTVANTLRLLRLLPEIRQYLLQGQLSAGHARAILSLDSEERQKELCGLILQRGLSVREAEAFAKQWTKRRRRETPSDRDREAFKVQLQALQEALMRRLGTKVQISTKGNRGKVEIEYYSSEDLERIVETILGGKPE